MSSDIIVQIPGATDVTVTDAPASAIVITFPASTETVVTVIDRGILYGVQGPQGQAGGVNTVNGQSGNVMLDTSEIPENPSYLYYTQARFDSAFAAKSTTNLAEGTNQYFTESRVRAVVLTGLSLATNAVISATDSVLSAFGKLQAQITANLSTLTSHTSNTSNPHSVTKAQVGLGNADNTSDANKPVSTATQTALNAKQDTLVSGTNIKTVNSTSILGSGDISVGVTSVTGTAPISSSGGATPAISISQANATTNGFLSSTDWNTFNGKQNALGFTAVPNTRTLTINGTAYDLSSDRTWTISTGITIGTTAITSGTVGRVLFEGAGNVVSESANLFWDNTNGRLGIGTNAPSAIIHSVGSVTASSLIARGVYFNNTLVAAANNDVLIGLDITSTFTNGAFTGVTNWGLRSTGLAQFKNTSGQLVFEVNDFTRIQSGISAIVYGNGTQATFRIYPGQSTAGFNLLSFAATSGVSTIDGSSNRLDLATNSTARLSVFTSTGNVAINTQTDAGYKLDVNGTVRIQSGLTIANVGTYALTVSNGTTSGIGSQYFNAGGILYWGVNNSTGDFLISTNGISYASFLTTTTKALQLGTNQTARLTIFPTTGNIAINTITDVASALLTMESTTKGFLPPRMTTTQKNAIASPATGLMIYDTTLNVITYYNGTMWI